MLERLQIWLLTITFREKDEKTGEGKINLKEQDSTPHVTRNEEHPSGHRSIRVNTMDAKASPDAAAKASRPLPVNHESMLEKVEAKLHMHRHHVDDKPKEKHVRPSRSFGYLFPKESLASSGAPVCDACVQRSQRTWMPKIMRDSLLSLWELHLGESLVLGSARLSIVLGPRRKSKKWSRMPKRGGGMRQCRNTARKHKCWRIPRQFCSTRKLRRRHHSSRVVGALSRSLGGACHMRLLPQA